MKLAMPKVLDQGTKRPSLDTSRILGLLMTSERHSERLSTRESGSTEWFQTWTGMSPLVR